MKELLINVLQLFGLAWWVEIVTEQPQCTYYFGPFLSAADAETAQSGYLEDLQHEGAQNITTRLKRCKPNQLTVFDEGSEFPGGPSPSPIFSGQT